MVKNKYKEDTYVANGCKVLGASMPPVISNYVALYGISNDSTQSDILRGAMRDWYRVNKNRKPKHVLIREVTNKIQEEWNRLRERSVDANEAFFVFKERTRNKLQKRGVETGDVDLILNNLIYE